MRELVKIFILVFVAVLLPVTLINASQLYFAQSCDPKLGCLGTFKLLTFISAASAIISALAISVAHYIFIGRCKSTITTLGAVWLLICCIALSFANDKVIPLAESIGLPLLIVTWAISSFLMGAAIFRFYSKK